MSNNSSDLNGMATSNWLTCQAQTKALSEAQDIFYFKAELLATPPPPGELPPIIAPVWRDEYIAQNPLGQGNSSITGSVSPGSFQSTGTPPNYE